MLTTELESVWIASDGKKFLSQSEAEIHEAKLSTEKDIRYWDKLKKEQEETLRDQIKEKIEWLEKQQQKLK